MNALGLQLLEPPRSEGFEFRRLEFRTQRPCEFLEETDVNLPIQAEKGLFLANCRVFGYHLQTHTGSPTPFNIFASPQPKEEARIDDRTNPAAGRKDFRANVDSLVGYLNRNGIEISHFNQLDLVTHCHLQIVDGRLKFDPVFSDRSKARAHNLFANVNSDEMLAGEIYDFIAAKIVARLKALNPANVPNLTDHSFSPTILPILFDNHFFVS